MSVYLPAIFIAVGLILAVMGLVLYFQKRAAEKLRNKTRAERDKEIAEARASVAFNVNFGATPKDLEITKTSYSLEQGRSPAQYLVPIIAFGGALLYLTNQYLSPEEVATEPQAIAQSPQPSPLPLPEPAPVAEAPPAAAPSPSPTPAPTVATAPAPQPTQTSKPVEYVQKEWKAEKAPDYPHFDTYLKDLRSYQFVFVYDKNDEKIKIPKAKGSPLVRSLTAWKKWSEHHKITTERCDWKNLNKCPKAATKRIYIVLPGNWNFSHLEKLMAQGENIILFGMPYQIYDPRRQAKTVNFKNLVFEKFARDTQNWFVLKGDQTLTLGLEAGLRLNLPPLVNNYRVRSNSPNAVGVAAAGFAAPVRLEVVKDAKSRVVWLDFLPEIKGPSEPVQAGIFRYLLRKKHYSFANWPQKSNLASAVFLESQNPAQDVANVVNELKSKNNIQIPITWIVEPSLLKTTLKLPEGHSVLCRLSFANTKTLSEAIQKVADCRKAVKLATGKEVAGLMTSDEPVNTITYDAMFYNQLRLIVTKSARTSPMPYVQKSQRSYILVVPTSYNTLASLSPETTDSHFRSSRNAASFSQVLMSVGQFLGQPKSLRDFLANVTNAQGRFLTSEELAEWRISRERLLWGESVAAGLTAKYTPFTLRMDDSGDLMAQGLSGAQDRMPASEVILDEK